MQVCFCVTFADLSETLGVDVGLDLDGCHIVSTQSAVWGDDVDVEVVAAVCLCPSRLPFRSLVHTVVVAARVRGRS